MSLHKYKIKEFGNALLLTAGILTLSACVSDKEAAEPGGRRTGEVRIGAFVEDITETRAQGSKIIESGTYYMTYPNNPEKTTHSVCTVNFHDGFGVTTTSANKELKWEEVGSLTYSDVLTNFFLDNVAPPVGVDPNATEIPFTEDFHPFDAAVYAGDGGYNDLLWGYAFVDLFTTAEINIGIHHYMSRVSVIVTVDNSLENAQEIDFDAGSVKITNVVKKGVSYSRVNNGSISLGDEPDYEDLELAVEGGWESKKVDESDPNITYYQTKNFVIPPQTLRTDDRRPRLVIDVPQPDGTIRTYSGVIPRVMMVDGSPATMAFDKEKNLTLKVKISQDRLRIESIVAYVQDWVNKGTFTVSSSYGTVATVEAFNTLINIYPDQDEEQLRDYGFHHTYDGNNFWTFNVLTDPVIKVEDVKGKWAEPLPDFSFDFTSHKFKLVDNNGKQGIFGNGDTWDQETSREIEKVLHDLLRYGTVPELNEEYDGRDYL